MELMLLTKNQSQIRLDPVVDLLLSCYEQDVLTAVEGLIKKDQKNTNDPDWYKKRSNAFAALQKTDHPLAATSSERALLLTALAEVKPASLDEVPTDANAPVVMRDDVCKAIVNMYNEPSHPAPFIEGGTLKPILKVAIPYLTPAFSINEIRFALQRGFFRKEIQYIPWVKPWVGTGRRSKLTSLNDWHKVNGTVQGVHSIPQTSSPPDDDSNNPIEIAASQAAATNYDREWSFTTLPLSMIRHIQHLNRLPSEVLDLQANGKLSNAKDQSLYRACYEHLLNNYNSGNDIHKLCVLVGYIVAVLGHNLSTKFEHDEKETAKRCVEKMRLIAKKKPFYPTSPVEQSTSRTHAAVAVIVLYAYLEPTSPWSRRKLSPKRSEKEIVGFRDKASKPTTLLSVSPVTNIA
jgi:hypothetical protein